MNAIYIRDKLYKTVEIDQAEELIHLLDKQCEENDARAEKEEEWRKAIQESREYAEEEEKAEKLLQLKNLERHITTYLHRLNEKVLF